MSYLICSNCNGYYKLRSGESPEDFESCECSGKLEQYETLYDYVDKIYGLNYSGLEKENERLKNDYNQLKETYNQLNDDYFKQSSESHELKIINYDFESENLKLKEFQDKINEINKWIEEENEGLKDRLNGIKDKYSKLKSENSNLEEDYTEIEAEISKLKDNYSRLEIKNSELTEELTELQKENKELENNQKKLSHIYAKLEEENLKLKVDHFNLKEKYSALKNEGKMNDSFRGVKLEFSNKDDDGILKTHIVCEDCGNKLPLSQFYKTKSNDRGYTTRCKSCTRKRNAANGLVELSKYIDLDVPFSKDELRNVVGEQFPAFENYLWVLLELDILNYLENEDKYVLKLDDKLKDFCGTYGISLAL